MLTTTVILCSVFGIAMIESPMQSVDDFSFYLILIVGFALVALFFSSLGSVQADTPTFSRLSSSNRQTQRIHREVPIDPWMPRSRVAPAGTIERCEPWVGGKYQSVQVNVNAEGCNVVGDAANEPSIAIDPTNPNSIIIGWRQFDTV